MKITACYDEKNIDGEVMHYYDCLIIDVQPGLKGTYVVAINLQNGRIFTARADDFHVEIHRLTRYLAAQSDLPEDALNVSTDPEAPWTM